VDPTQPNPRVNPTHGQLWDRCRQRKTSTASLNSIRCGTRSQSCSQYSVIQVPVQGAVLESQVPVPVPVQVPSTTILLVANASHTQQRCDVVGVALPPSPFYYHSAGSLSAFENWSGKCRSAVVRRGRLGYDFKRRRIVNIFRGRKSADGQAMTEPQTTAVLNQSYTNYNMHLYFTKSC